MIKAVTFHEISEFLSSKQEGRPSLQEHLGDVLTKLMTDKPENPIEVFEEISHFVKNTKYDSSELQMDQNVNKIGISENKQNLEAWLDKVKEILLPSEYIDDEYDGPSLTGNVGFVADVINQQSLLQWAGCDLSKEYSYYFQKSLCELSRRVSAKEVRLFGKILCRNNDYWIAEVKGGLLEGDNKINIEERGNQLSVNQLSYWVTHSPLDDWQVLPDVSPEMINISRNIKYIFTGNLNNHININPYFKGQERDLLRCQIARISHGTILSPANQYMIDEDDEDNEGQKKIKPSTEFKMSTEELANVENWVHKCPNILQCGQITHKKPIKPIEADDEWDENVELEKIINVDPYLGRLLPISDDKQLGEIIKTEEDTEKKIYAWKSRQYNSNQKQKIPDELQREDGPTEHSQGINVITSLRWPGAVTVQKSGNFVNFQCGYGLKAGTNAFSPICPDEVYDDPIDKKEEQEPFPKEAPIHDDLNEENTEEKNEE